MKTRTRKLRPVSIPASRWLAYAGAGAATTLVSVGSADAEIHYSGHVDVTFRHNDTKSVEFSIEPGAFLLFRHDSDFFNDVGAAFFHAEGRQSGAFVGYFIGFEYGYVSRLKGDGNRYVSQGYFINDSLGGGGYYFGTMAKEGGKEGPGKSGAPASLGFASITAPGRSMAGRAFRWAGRIPISLSPCWTTPGQIPEKRFSPGRQALHWECAGRRIARGARSRRGRSHRLAATLQAGCGVALLCLKKRLLKRRDQMSGAGFLPRR